jgi:hypothetical protein
MKTMSKMIMAVALTLAILTWASSSEAGWGNRKSYGHPGYHGRHQSHRAQYHHRYYQPRTRCRVDVRQYYYAPARPLYPPLRYPSHIHYYRPGFFFSYGSPDFHLGIGF